MQDKKNEIMLPDGFDKRINLKIPITLFHGKKDEVVPVYFSKKVLSDFYTFLIKFIKGLIV